ncbi:MAG TPA: hypothetical protein VEE86_02460 [Thermoplasmata archaeon]|nr:hypothetical protein [Thermoplasmata archaeon]
MSSTDTLTVSCRGSPSLRRLWYAELARLVASAPPPAAALFEGSTGHPHLRTTVRPAGIVEALRHGVAGGSVRVEECTAEAPHPPPALGHEWTGFVVRTGTDPDGTPEEGLRIDRVGISPVLDAGTWLGLQTFWVPSDRGTLSLACRFRFAARRSDDLDQRFRALGTVVAAEWSRTVGVPASFRAGAFGSRRDWRNGGLRTIPPEGWFERPPEVAARSVVALEPPSLSSRERPVETPAIVLGASGAGKTTYLARWAAGVVGRGGSVVVIDLHGDLAPAILGRLSAGSRQRVVAADVTRPPVPGVAALARDGPQDRAAAHLVAALKRLTPDGTDLYWGFRLERIFDSFVRLALESEGSVTDVYDLLTNADRRDAARLATRSAELARFLEELSPVVRRNPEFLWSAATRLSKVVLVPALRELLAPEAGGLPVEALLEDGRSLLVRLPFASLGPEAAAFAATLVLGRVYLGVATRAERRRRPLAVSLVLDEVQALSPRLVAEVLTEGRKFGFRTIVATQYPGRLARELENAARGALRGFVVFRVPRPSAVEVGGWLGLGPAEAAEMLPNLPTGEGLVLDPAVDGVRPTASEGEATPADADGWEGAVEETQREFAVSPASLGEGFEADAATERLLLTVLASTESGSGVRRENAVSAAASLPGTAPDPALLAVRLATLLRDGYLGETEAGLRLTPSGERRLGLTAPTGATRESAEHRALLMATFRHFARRGYRLEILRQGRFDTTLPDGRFRQLPERSGALAPADLANAIERARRGWAWRFFHGRDVHVEAEVSGALRSERVRHGVRKALARDAFVLFVVGDARRARRVRSVLRAMDLGVDRAQVWTLEVPLGPTSPPRTTNP